MTRSAEIALLVTVGVLTASAALAQPGVPSSITSTQPVPLRVLVVPTFTPPNNSDPPPISITLNYVIRDDANNPVAGCLVTLDFGGCSDARICSSEVWPGNTVNCSGATRTVSATSGSDGRVTFAISGAGRPAGPFEIGPCVTVDACGVSLSSLRAPSIDFDGVDGVQAIDSQAFSTDLLGPVYHARSDFDGDGVVSGIDGGIFILYLFDSNPHVSCSSLCP